MAASSQTLFQQLQKQLVYCYEANRRATYKKWVFKESSKCSAAKLAEAGFCFTGGKLEPDSVKCFFCGKSLDSWDEDDDPWLEHQKHAPNCAFAQMNKPEKAFTLTEFIEIKNQFILKFTETELRKNIDKVNEEFDDLVQLVKAIK